MKTKLERCEICKEETVQDIGKKQGTNKSGAYIRRRTSRCRQCGTREIHNQKQGRRVVSGKNFALDNLQEIQTSIREEKNNE